MQPATERQALLSAGWHFPRAASCTVSGSYSHSANAPFPVQTSLYGASKVPGKCLIQAYCEGFGVQAHFFRVVSILGLQYTQGHIIDSYNQLRKDPARLKLLGDCMQRKSSLLVDDCVRASCTCLAPRQRRTVLFFSGRTVIAQLDPKLRLLRPVRACAISGR